MVGRWRWIGLLLAFVAVLGLSGSVAARELGFIIQETGGLRGRLFPTQAGYVYQYEIQNIGLDGPQDLFIDKDQNLFIVDTGNNRILKIDREGNKLLEFGNTGQEQLRKPEGVFVHPDGRIYVADTGNKRIVVYNADGTLNRIFKQPESILLGQDFHYQPTKLVVDRRDYMYVINSNDYRGMVTLDGDGDFRGFFAPNRLSFSLRRFLINLFATEAQKEKLSKDLPTPHSNVFIDDSGYIYSSTVYDRTNQLKKMNAVGNDILNRLGAKPYGLAWGVGFQLVQPNLVDLAVNQYGVISTVDSATGFIYQYDQDRNLLLIFGGKGEEKGRFGFPSSIVVDRNERLYILDKDRNNIQVFRQTQFAELVHRASQLYFDGRYEEASEPWRRVLELNTNYTLAHRGIAKAYMKLEDWQNALVEYRIGEDRDGYSKAFAELRHDYIRANFGLVVLAVVAASVVVWLIGKFFGWVRRQPYEKLGVVLRTLQTLLNAMFDPYETFWLLKREKRGTIWVAIVLVCLAFAVRVIQIQFTSYQIADVDPQDVSIVTEGLRIFLPWLLWGLANYGVGAIMEGEGFFRDILIGTAYSLGPYLIFSPPLVLLSHVLSRAERGYYLTVQQWLLIWVGLLVFTQTKATHNFSNRRAIGMAAVTLFGMACIVFAVGLTYALTDQMVGFFRQVIIELTIRG